MKALARRVRANLAPWLICFTVSLVSCTSHEAPQPVMAQQCKPISGTRPVAFDIPSTTGGPLRITVEQRGISLIATLSSTNAANSGADARVPSSASAAASPVTSSLARDSARSPIERFGVMTFVPESLARQSAILTVQSRDSPDIVGEVCVSVDRLAPSENSRLRAEHAFAAAGRAVQNGDFQRAFDAYLAAARDLRQFDRHRAALSRHAMAELAYQKLSNEAGANVLATWALADLDANADRGMRSSLVSLQARTLLETVQSAADVRRARVFELLKAAQNLAEGATFGAREAPRLDILRGFMEYRSGDTAHAAQLFAQAASQCETMRDWECYARARQNMATLAEEARDFNVALQDYAEALRVLPRGLEPELIADIWGNLGRLQGMAGLFRRSERSSRVSIRLHGQTADCDGTRMGFARLGTLLVQVGSIAEGHTNLSRASSLDCPELLALALHESAEDSPNAEAPDATVDVAADRSMTNVGTEATCLNLPDPDTLSPAGKLAVFNALLGLREASRLESSDAVASRCLAAAGAYAGTARTKLRLANAEGAARLEHGDTTRASAAFSHGLDIADQAGLPETHENRSLAYLGLARSALLEKRTSAARSYASRALMLGSARADVSQVVESLQLMARSFSASTENATVVSILTTAAGLIEQVPIDDLDAEKRATWLATQHAVFAELTSLFVEGAQPNDARTWDAFSFSERGRARSIRYAVNQATDFRAMSSGEPASVRYRELMRRIADLAELARSGELQRSAASTGEAPGVSLDALGALAGKSDTAANASAPAFLQERLAALGATVVEYAAGRDDMFAFVIDSEHIRVLRLATRRDIAAAVATLYDRLRDPETAASDVRRASQRLAELVWWPIAGLISHAKVIFVPDDSLHTVPFGVLPWTSAPDASLVIQRVELSIMPSTLFITRAGSSRVQREHAPRLELIGDPIFRSSDWRRECTRPNTALIPSNEARTRSQTGEGKTLPRLPGSRAEVLAIAQLARRSTPSGEVRERLGCEATPSGLREAAAAGPDVLHIATHGYVDAYRPRLSALALTPEANSNGSAATFGLMDILDTRIASRLVVLSACDTSRGRLLPGEGVLGPAQAFLQAGAASVVASYWRIADAETAPFMQSFYKYLLTEHLTAAAALRRAQLDALQSGTTQGWAAFTLYGWPDTSF